MFSRSRQKPKDFELIDDMFYQPDRDRFVKVKGWCRHDGLPWIEVDYLDPARPVHVKDGCGHNIGLDRAERLAQAFSSRGEDGLFYQLLKVELK